METALLDPGVVLGADRGEKSHFLTAQTAHTPPLPSTESDLGRADFGTAGLEELTQLVQMGIAIHDLQLRTKARQL